MTSVQDESARFVRVGAGSFATVYAVVSRGFMVMKQVADPQRCLELEKEHKDLVILHEQVACQGLLFRIPKPMGYYESFEAFVQDNNLSPHDGSLDPPCLYIMERVHPVPYALSATIRSTLFPERGRSDARPFLARLYVGREKRDRPRENPFFNPLNFQLDVMMMEALDLPIGRIAREMGRMLARIHFVAGRDGRDIEFVLGGADHKRPCYFCIDFNQMRPHDGEASVLAESFYANDPYYPRPSSKHWDFFANGYMGEAMAAGSTELANEFLQKVVAGRSMS